MDKVTTIAIDLGKRSFDLIGENERGEEVMAQRLKSREAFYAYIVKLEAPLAVVMEVGLGAQAWARTLQERGLTVKLLPAQHVATHRSGHKNDRNDARAMLRANRDRSIHPVPVKSVEQLSLQALHRARRGWIQRKTALSNQIRGLLLEHGVAVAKGDAKLAERVSSALERASMPLTERLRELIALLWDDFRAQVRHLEVVERELVFLVRQDPLARRLDTIPGVGPITATALACKGLDADAFPNSRRFAAYFGGVPKQISTGGRTILGRMSRNGDGYIRSLAINGAQAVLRFVRDEDQSAEAKRIRRWRDKHGTKGAAVRIANRNFRIAWRIMRDGVSYQKAAARAPSSTQEI
jgi:transposase